MPATSSPGRLSPVPAGHAPCRHHGDRARRPSASSTRPPRRSSRCAMQRARQGADGRQTCRIRCATWWPWMARSTASIAAISQSQFLSKALAQHCAAISRPLAREFVGRMGERGGACDFSADIAMWYPLRVIMTILGIPPEDEALMLDFAQRTLSAGGSGVPARWRRRLPIAGDHGDVPVYGAGDRRSPRQPARRHRQRDRHRQGGRRISRRAATCSAIS